MTHQVNLENGKVVVTGNADGHPVTLEGHIHNVSIEVESYDNYSSSWWDDYTRLRLAPEKEYRLVFDVKDDKAFTWTTHKPVTVTRSARVEAADRTVEAYEKARQQVGAPNYAKVRVGDLVTTNHELTVTPLDQPTPIMVEFYWEEKI